MADVSIMRAVQYYSGLFKVFSGATLLAACSCLEVGSVWPAGAAAERAELGCGAPGAVYTSTAGLYVLVHVRQRDRAAWERSWSPRAACDPSAMQELEIITSAMQELETRFECT